MKAILYLYKRNMINNAKKAVRKPMTYLFAALILLYGVFLPYTFNLLLAKFELNTPAGMAAAFTIVTFWLVPANLISYAKRKGLLFKPGDVHLMFPAPLGPKAVLLYAHVKTLAVYVLVSLVILGCGIFLFHVPAWQLGIYFIVSLVVENIMEASVMILLYGSEKLGEKGRKTIKTVCYVVIAAFVALALLQYIQKGLSLESVLGFLHSDYVQMVPVVGWYIALIHLIFMGPTAVNVICAALYLIFTAVMLFLSVKMPCSGDYYEDATKFAEDYEELRAKKLNGEMASLGKRTKYGKAKVNYKGGGAKAIFYKQLLEYKKSKLFFFDNTTLIMMAIGIFVGFMYMKDEGMEGMRVFIIPAIMAYIGFCMSATPGKWGKEIKSPYTFLIPDSPMRKLWYATLLEHGKSAACGAILALPCGILLKLPPIQILLSIIMYVFLMACRLYNTVMIESLMGNSIGRTGKQLCQMLFQGIVISIAITAAALGVIFISIEAAYIIMTLVLALVSFALMTAANGCFDRMESVE